MDWNLFWTIILQVVIFSALFPFLCLPLGIGISFLAHKIRRTPTDQLILVGENSDH